MVYIGGGAGMAPLRAHLSHLLENEGTARKISYWYGARSLQEIFYEDYFEDLAGSTPTSPSTWLSPRRFRRTTGPDTSDSFMRSCWSNYLRPHANPEAAEFYLCGPPLMIKACTRMLKALQVPNHQIAYDEF